MDITLTKTFSPITDHDERYTLGIGPVLLVDGANYIGTEDECLIGWTATDVHVLCRQVERLRHRYVDGVYDTVDHVWGGEPEAIIFCNAKPGNVYVWAEGDGLHYCLIETGIAREITKAEAHRAYVKEESYYSTAATGEA